MSDIIFFQAQVTPGKIALRFIEGVIDTIDGVEVWTDGIPSYTPVTPAPSFNLRRATNPHMQENSRIVGKNLTASLNTATGDLEVRFEDESVLPGVTYYYDVDVADGYGDYTLDYSESIEVTAYGRSTLRIEAEADKVKAETLMGEEVKKKEKVLGSFKAVGKEQLKAKNPRGTKPAVKMSLVKEYARERLESGSCKKRSIKNPSNCRIMGYCVEDKI